MNEPDSDRLDDELAEPAQPEPAQPAPADPLSSDPEPEPLDPFEQEAAERLAEDDADDETTESDEPQQADALDSLDPGEFASKVKGDLDQMAEFRPAQPLAEAKPKSFRVVRTVDIEADPPLTQPLTLGLGPEATLFVLDRPAAGRFRVLRVPYAGGIGEVAMEFEHGTSDNELLDPAGIAVDSEGRIVIPDMEAGAIKTFSNDGRWLSTHESAGESGTRFDNPRDVDIDAEGNLYIADTYNNRIVKLDRDGELCWELEQFTDPDSGEEDELYEPGSVCVCGNRVAIADTNQSRVLTADADGTVQRVIEADGMFEYPSEVRLDDEGRLFIADQSNLRLTRLDAAGTTDGVIDLRDQREEPLDGGGDIDIDEDGHVVLVDPIRECVVVLEFASGS